MTVIEPVKHPTEYLFRILKSGVTFSVDKKWHNPEGWIVTHAYVNEPHDLDITLTDQERDEVEAWLTANVVPEYPD